MPTSNTRTGHSTLAEELCFVPEQHLTEVVQTIVSHEVCPELVMATGTLLQLATTVSWARRPDNLLGLDIAQDHDLVAHFHYPDLFHTALHHAGDLRDVDHIADLVGAVLAGKTHLHH
ncbi:hypothetical protein [Kitasatospora brasiliensis]|uniref:hypothetical protein n=1 Tax=Kitasatospora brasiliensis TaxID=3058040 RepID=UPI00292FFC67|nr:hypothetical protein [Kitasatospora sp. K002]